MLPNIRLAFFEAPGCVPGISPPSLHVTLCL